MIGPSPTTATWSRQNVHNPAVYTAEELAELAGVSTWSIYQAVKAEESPFPFLKIGRRILFPKAPADRLLGLSTEEAQ